MRVFILLFILITLPFKAHGCDLHVSLTDDAQKRILELPYGMIGDNSLYLKVAVINHNWFYKSPVFPLFFTEEEWEDRITMTCNLNNMNLYSRSSRFAKTQQSDDDKEISFQIDTDKLTSPDLKITLLNNHNDFNERLPNSFLIKEVHNAKIFVTLDYDSENGFYYKN